MRWPVVKTIWFREVRDQLRDRRTVFMLVVLPLVLYPALGIAVPQLVGLAGGQRITIGISGHEFLTAEDAPAGEGGRMPRLAKLPPLVNDAGDQFHPTVVKTFAPADTASSEEIKEPVSPRVKLGTEADLRADLHAGRIHALIQFGAGAVKRLKSGERVTFQPCVVGREEAPAPTAAEVPVWIKGDEGGAMAYSELRLMLRGWEEQILRDRVALLQAEIPLSFHDPIAINPLTSDNGGALWSRMFPFLLVMMSLTGALYPAIDVCAGEKERGTMETLLISPASRAEIVGGKFLTVWVFSTSTALLNLASLGFTTWQLAQAFSGAGRAALPLPSLDALAWCVVLLVPLAAFFSAICVALAVYARSTREGQYYLMPLMLTTLPLTLLALMPGFELGPLTCLIPITGPTLLLQTLINPQKGSADPVLYLAPVLLPLAAYGYLALHWAIQQFNREEVLFRGAERLDLGRALRRLFQEKRSLPSASMAVAAFALIMLAQWVIMLNAGSADPLVATGVALVAGVAAPVVLMAVLLTTRPTESLQLGPPRTVGEAEMPRAAGLAAITRHRWGWLAVAFVLALAMHAPMLYFSQIILEQFPQIRDDLLRFQKQVMERYFGEGRSPVPIFLVMAVLPGICEELAFRGFILSGLRKRMGPHRAVLASALLFALAHGNAFQFLPTLLLGIVFGWMATRSGSIWPGVFCHMVHNGLICAVTLAFRDQFLAGPAGSDVDLGPWGVVYGWPGLVVSLFALILVLPGLYQLPTRK